MLPERKLKLLPLFEISSLLLMFPFFFNSYSFSGFSSYDFDLTILRSGDIIFREGLSFVSRMVLIADSDSPYSHTGMIYIEGDKVYVLHAVPAEENWETEIIKIEPINEFLRKDRTAAIAIYRPVDQYDNYVPAAVDAALNFAKHKIKFDADFNLRDDSELYCTELIWKAYLKSGIDLVDSKFDFLNVPLMRGEYILPGSLLKSRYLQNIFSTKFR